MPINMQVEYPKLQQEVIKLKTILKECEPYIHDLDADNFDDRNAGIFKDEKLSELYIKIKNMIL